MLDFVAPDRPISWKPEGQHSWRITIARTSQQGQRDEQQDKLSVKYTGHQCLACVCDGHYGRRAAHYVAKSLPKHVLNELGGTAPKHSFLQTLMALNTFDSGSRSSRGTYEDAHGRRTDEGKEGRIGSTSSQFAPAESLPTLLTRCFREMDDEFLE